MRPLQRGGILQTCPDGRKAMPLTDEDVSTSMQRENQFESRQNDARAYLEAADYESALTEVQEARRLLAPGASSAEMDAIVGTAQSARARVEGRDRQKQGAWQQQVAMEEMERELDEQERSARALDPDPTQRRRLLILRLAIRVVTMFCVVGAIILWLGPGLLAAAVIGFIAIIAIILKGMMSPDLPQSRHPKDNL